MNPAGRLSHILPRASMYISFVVNLNVNIFQALPGIGRKGGLSAYLTALQFESPSCINPRGHLVGMGRDLPLSLHLIHPSQPKPEETCKLGLQRRKSRKLMSTEISRLMVNLEAEHYVKKRLFKGKVELV